MMSRNVIFRMVENETEIDLILIRNDHQRFMQDVKTIPAEFQHAIMIYYLRNFSTVLL